MYSIDLIYVNILEAVQYIQGSSQTIDLTNTCNRQVVFGGNVGFLPTGA